jgi:glucose-1-phosphate cytidylyltransferase
MKVVILAGGYGTRISEESQTRPKPMVEIGGRPILWHIMKLYGHHGFTDFIVCLGYKGYVIKEYFANFILHNSDVVVDGAGGKLEFRQTSMEPWRVSLIDTGEETLTGGRLKRIRDLIDPGTPFCMTYGDGVADVDLTAAVAFHERHGKLATVTAVVPPGRYGALEIDNENIVRRFTEKPPGDQGFINGGFFVLDPKVIDRIPGDETSWESGVLEGLANDGELRAFRHHGFWHPMDTLRDKTFLEEMWTRRKAPWKVWR